MMSRPKECLICGGVMQVTLRPAGFASVYDCVNQDYRYTKQSDQYTIEIFKYSGYSYRLITLGRLHYMNITHDSTPTEYVHRGSESMRSRPSVEEIMALMRRLARTRCMSDR